MFSFLLLIACATPPESTTPAGPEGQAAGGQPGAPADGAAAPATPGEPGAPAADGTAEPRPSGRAWTSYGGELDINAAIPAATLLSAPQDYVGQQVVVEGRVADVCQKKGCWMVLADGDQTMRVTMKDHGFTVDMNGTGGDCQIMGTVLQKEVDAETVAHYASESKNADAMPEPAEGGQTFEIEATAVRMRPAGG